MPRVEERDSFHALCSRCNEYKEHFETGIISTLGTLVFIGNNGTRWRTKGRDKVCPDCADVHLSEKGKEKQRILPQLLNVNGKPRICRACKYRVLPLSRYMHCEICKPTLASEVNEDFVYNDMGD